MMADMILMHLHFFVETTEKLVLMRIEIIVKSAPERCSDADF
jgi:hypothetical protein